MNEKTKSYIEHMLKKLDFSDASNDKANLYYMTCILQAVIDMNEIDRKYFDEHYAFTTNFNNHGYGSTSVKITFSSSGIKIWNADELKVRRTIDMFINEGINDKKGLIDIVADDLANDYAYKNDFDRYQCVDRDDRIYNYFYKYYSKLAAKELK